MANVQRLFNNNVDGRTGIIIIQIRKYNIETKQDDQEVTL
jgi:hypothetical protein